MSDNSIFSKKWNETVEVETAYRRLSVLSLLSVFTGLATGLVFISVWWFFVGIIGTILSLFALWTIKNSDGLLTGKGFAYTGLILSVGTLTAVTVFWNSYLAILHYQSDKVFRQCFVNFQSGDIPAIYDSFEYQPEGKEPVDSETWWKNKYSKAHGNIHGFLEKKELRTLISLGKDATYSYYKTLDTEFKDSSSSVITVFAVSYKTKAGKPETFFIKISADKLEVTPWRKKSGWFISMLPQIYTPEEFKSVAKKSEY